MTVTANGKRPTLTDGEFPGDVHVRVRADENPPSGVSGPDPNPRTTRAYAISRGRLVRPLSDAHMFVSLSVTELVVGVASGWAATEQLPPLAATWRRVFPAPGEASGRLSWLGLSAAGVVRALFHTAGFGLASCAATRKRAAVMGCVVLALAGIYCAGRLVG